MRELCAQQCRPLFEEAARAQYTEGGDIAGLRIGEALAALHRCLGITPDIEQAITEVERWFSFFGLWWSARLLERGETAKAWEILVDQAESYSPARASVLGILQDYGEHKTQELHQGTMCALELIQDKNLRQASVEADKVADIQYRLAVEKTGIPAPD